MEGGREVAKGGWVKTGWGLAGCGETGVPGSWGSNGVCVFFREVSDDVHDSRRESRNDGGRPHGRDTRGR